MPLHVSGEVQEETIFLSFGYAESAPRLLNIQCGREGRAQHGYAVNFRIVEANGEDIDVGGADSLSGSELCYGLLPCLLVHLALDADCRNVERAQEGLHGIGMLNGGAEDHHVLYSGIRHIPCQLFGYGLVIPESIDRFVEFALLVLSHGLAYIFEVEFGQGKLRAQSAKIASSLHIEYSDCFDVVVKNGTLSDYLTLSKAIWSSGESNYLTI